MSVKVFKSPNYNFIFDMQNGFFARWGKTEQDDPEYSPFGNEILDIEVSTICTRACKWCYKSNTCKGKNMSYDTFRTIMDKMPVQLTQIAIGIGDIDANPDLWKMMEYCRMHNIIPNVTINGERMTDDLYDRLAKYCGAVAVSLYDKDTCYNAVKALTDRGMTQVNIHALLSKETYMNCYTTLLDRIIDPRIEKLNAVVFLWLKPKGNRNHLHQLDSMKKFQDLIETAIETGGKFGFDSCTASNFLKATKGFDSYEQFKIMSEPCESTLFSYYINVDGIGFPCSFCEGVCNGVDVVGCQDFVKDIWNAKDTKQFREMVMSNKDVNGCRMCPVYNLKLE